MCAAGADPPPGPESSPRPAGTAAAGDALGLPRVHFRRTDSTNERARALASSGAPHGTLLTAAEQTAGRGRHGRVWTAPAGSSVLMSLVLRRWPPLLPLAAAVAVCDVAGERALVKWPNDVVVERGELGGGYGREQRGAGRPGERGGQRAADTPQGAGRPGEPSGPHTAGEPREAGEPASSCEPSRPVTAAAPNGLGGPGAPDGPDAPRDQLPPAKLAGILIEGRPTEGWMILGIGLNVAVEIELMPQPLRDTVATMGRSPGDVEPVLAELLRALEARLAEPAQRTLSAWRARDALRGRRVAWSGGEGIAGGIDDGGRLLVLDWEGRAVAALDSGEVSLRG